MENIKCVDLFIANCQIRIRETTKKHLQSVSAEINH